MTWGEPVPSRLIVVIVLILAILLLASGFVWLGMIGPWPKPDSFEVLGSPFFTYLYNYQTLITGLLAVTAALFTVGQMQLGERESQRRHNELVDLSLRADRLTVERWLLPQFANLKKAQMGFERLNILSDQKIRWDTVEKLVLDDVRTIYELCRQVVDVVSHPAWGDAERLFGGVLTDDISQMNKHLASCEELTNQIAQARYLKKTVIHDGEQTHMLEHFVAFKVPPQIEWVCKALQATLDGMSEMARQYGIELKKA